MTGPGIDGAEPGVLDSGTVPDPATEEKHQHRVHRPTRMSPALKAELRRLKWFSPLLVLILIGLAVLGMGFFASGIAVGRQDWQKQDLKPESVGLTPKTVRFQSRDGIPLAAWYERSWVTGQPRGTVILVHGPKGNKARMAGLGTIALQRGFCVLIPDLRSNGDSGGTYTTFGYREAADVIAAARWAESNGNGPIVLWGYSSGAVAVLHAAAQVPDGIAAVIADSPFMRISDVLARESEYLGRSGGNSDVPWSYRLRLWLFTRPAFEKIGRWAFEVRTGVPFDPPESDLVAAVRRIQAPVLYAAAEGDPVVPVRETRTLYQATPNPKKQLLVQPGKFHSGFVGNPQRYVAATRAFLDQNAPAR